MTQPEPQSANEWYKLGRKQYWNQKNYEAALISFNHSLKLDSKNYKVWNEHGNTLKTLGKYQDAITSFNKALDIKSDYPNSWCNQGLVLHELEQYAEAIISFKKALEIDDKHHQAWNGIGNSQKGLGKYEEAITSYRRALDLDNQYWRAWKNRGWALFTLLRYQEALKNWNDGLQQLKQTNDSYSYKEGCGELHRCKGDAQYQIGQKTETETEGDPLPYWQDAISSYETAIKFSTFENASFRERHLEVLQNLIKVHWSLDKKNTAQMLESEGSELLGRLLQEKYSDTDKIRLSRKFAAFNQYRVDSLAQSEQCNAALKLAEQRKNICLSWLRDNHWVDPTELMASIELPLLNSQTAVIYWHISPAAITTFIIKDNQPLLVLQPQLPSQSRRKSYSSHIYKLHRFEEWMQQWKHNYKDYCEKNYIDTAKENASWRHNMEYRLFDQLSEILEIDRISAHLQNIDTLILIPHRELHLLPLDCLFNERFTITYLPSFQIGKHL